MKYTKQEAIKFKADIENAFRCGVDIGEWLHGYIDTLTIKEDPAPNPCPFCGGKAEAPGDSGLYITCRKCIVRNITMLLLWGGGFFVFLLKR